MMQTVGVNSLPANLSHRVTVSLAEGELTSLSKIASENDASVSWVIRRAIKQYLTHDQVRVDIADTTRKPSHG